MARRKEVFQSKVLQKLFPKPPKQEKAQSPPHSEVLVKKTLVKSNTFQVSDGTVIGDGGIRASEAHPARRVYTVLSPPAEYETGAEGLVTHSQPADINTAGDPAVEDAAESNQEEEEDEVAEQPRRRRRRKRKSNGALQQPSMDGRGQANEPMADRSNVRQTSEEGGEQLSKNKRRKLKKRRHKEKLLSLGLVPRAAALEFTYERKREEEEEEEEEEEGEGGEGEEEPEPEPKERRNADLCGFLRTTMETYLSDRLLPADRLPPPPVAVVEGLLSSISSDTAPPSVLKQIHTLRTLVELREPQRLAEALEELHSSSTMPADEAAAVVFLFGYWITDIFPMQEDTVVAQ